MYVVHVARWSRAGQFVTCLASTKYVFGQAQKLQTLISNFPSNPSLWCQWNFQSLFFPSHPRDTLAAPTYKFFISGSTMAARRRREVDCGFCAKKQRRIGGRNAGDSEQIIWAFFATYWIYFSTGVEFPPFDGLKRAWKTHKVPRTVGEKINFSRKLPATFPGLLICSSFSGFAVDVKQKQKKVSKVRRRSLAGNLLNLANYFPPTFW